MGLGFHIRITSQYTTATPLGPVLGSPDWLAASWAPGVVVEPRPGGVQEGQRHGASRAAGIPKGRRRSPEAMMSMVESIIL